MCPDAIGPSRVAEDTVSVQTIGNHVSAVLALALTPFDEPRGEEEDDSRTGSDARGDCHPPPRNPT
jgi:hypothetical protein